MSAGNFTMLPESPNSKSKTKGDFRRGLGRALFRVVHFARAKTNHVKIAIKYRRGAEKVSGAHLNVIVVSPGGVATTAIMSHLQRFLNVNCPDDRDGLKHLPYPPSFIDEKQKVLFIKGDVEQICRSIRRRGWISIQGAKLGSIWPVILPEPFSSIFFKRAVQKQVACWEALSARKNDNVMVIDYNQIWDMPESIMRFCCISDKEFLSKFPKRNKRFSI